MIIAPSFLASDFSRVAHEAKRVDRSGADWLHLDIMDGNFVPNISFGPAFVKSVRPHCKKFFDVHLMCEKPDILFEPFVQAGADQMIVHVELGDQVAQLLWKIKSFGKKAGLAINPPTTISNVLPYLDKIDSLLVMTVNPGFGGQEFIYETLPKIQQAAAWRTERRLNFHIGVDGGVNFETCAECARVGADVFVSGTTIFHQRSMKAAVRKMRKIVNAHDPALADLAVCVEAVFERRGALRVKEQRRTGIIMKTSVIHCGLLVLGVACLLNIVINTGCVTSSDNAQSSFKVEGLERAAGPQDNTPVLY